MPEIIQSDPPCPPIWPYPTGLIYSREFWGVNLRMVRGNTFKFTASVVIDGVLQNVAGGSFLFTAKYDFDQTDVNAVFQKTSDPSGGIEILDAATGSLQITLNPTDTIALPYTQVDLVYDLEYTTASDEIFSILRGTLTVVPNVSRPVIPVTL